MSHLCEGRFLQERIHKAVKVVLVATNYLIKSRTFQYLFIMWLIVLLLKVSKLLNLNVLYFVVFVYDFMLLIYSLLMYWLVEWSHLILLRVWMIVGEHERQLVFKVSCKDAVRLAVMRLVFSLYKFKWINFQPR